ncbi:Bromodomain [Leishmania donovani]|uniref:Bromodomain family protein n=1 Tax=Leishmania donovani TaxID=5661 RepID=A0A504X194_LEIDO|nr:Bromodomain family protein [Leishmania donovani]CAJ1986642.1 Bromodomain [Leishmania donovani]VDZ42537.1 Bromodomain_putative/Pfam:PF00439 [Leishmania donovani]
MSATPKLYNEADVAALVRSLDRAEDHHIFAVDVLETYPYLAESYTKVCPRRCDLATAAQKALEGAYSYDLRLEGLKADIALMASNCVAYNGPTSAYAETAAKFERYALEQIDAFVLEHNGGCRVSRLRLPRASASQEHASADGTAPKKGSAGTSAAPPSTREMVQLVDSLNRREDGGAFSVDVAEAYPDLRDSYRKICPRPMNLILMRQRAKEGYYTSGSATVYGDTVAASLTRLREDIELLVRNCITFNVKVESWVTLARSFQAFAHRRVDDFVLRHAAFLRGTTMGAEVYESKGNASTSAPLATASGSAGGDDADRSGQASPTAAADTVTVTSGGIGGSAAAAGSRKRERVDERVAASGGRLRAPVPVSRVQVVAEATPQVCPTPLQPSLTIPPLLRRRLTMDHVRHTRLPLRRVGVSVLRDELYPPAVSPADVKASSDSSAAAGGAEAATTSTAMVNIDASCSASHVLKLLRESVVKFFAAQRSGTDFVDTFAYSAREEQLYLSVLAVVAEKYQSTAAHLLLYETESAELQEWAALRALDSCRDAGRTAPAPADAGDTIAGDLHYLYFVRFLVQWPQLASLCCTTATPSSVPASAAAARGASGAAQGSLRISREQLKVVAQVTHITQEFLQFLEAMEERQRQ